MDVDKIIARLPQESLKSLKDRQANIERTLTRDPEHAAAYRLQVEVKAELAKRKMASRIRVGPLWWEPSDQDVPEFFAYETADSLTAVASIFKSNTHTATRKDVYSVGIGIHKLPGRFAEVASARNAGSDAWEKGLR